MRFRLGTVLLVLILAGVSPRTSSTARLKPGSDEWVRAKVDALVAAARAAYDDDDRHMPAYRRVVQAIASAIKQGRLSENESFLNRYPEFAGYVEQASLDRLPGHELGFAVSDKQYFAETRQYVEIPEFLTSQSFLRFVSRSETLDRAKSFLRQINSTREPSEQLTFFSYTSRHLGTPDNDDSYIRLLIVVPGNPEKGVPEKWVQFGVTDPATRVRTRNLSVVSAVVRADGTFDSYFKDYFRTYRRDGSISIKGRWELGFGDDNCARCHKSGVLPIFPEKGSVSADEQQAVEAVNRRFKSYGSPRFAGYLDERKFGPGLGAARTETRNRRFGESFADTSIGRAMSCTACHRPEGLGALNWPLDDVIISSYIKGGHMPLGHELTQPERDELYDKLIEEYFSTDNSNPGILKSWLLGLLR